VIFLLLAFLLTVPLAAEPESSEAVVPPSSVDIGRTALTERRLSDAQGAFEDALAADPDDVEAHWELGWVYWLREDWSAAAKSWSAVARLQPDHPEVGEWLPSAQGRARLGGGGIVTGEVPREAAGATVSFAAAGDTMMGTATRKGARGLAPNDGADIFTGVDTWLRAADVAFLNLEGPLADDHVATTKCRPGSTSCYEFRTPTRYVAALQGAGIDLASLANNHASDCGPAGMESSMATLDAVGIGHSGRYGDVALIERDGVKIGLVAAHSGGCCLNVNRLDEVTAAIVELDERADIVLFSFHGGAEGAAHRHVPGKTEIAWGERRGDVKALARAAVDAGADLVLGHGPHVLRAMEVYRGRLVVYSMGNFVGYNQFGTRGGYGGTSVVVEADLAANGVLRGARIRPVALDSLAQPRPDPEGAAWAQIQELSDADFPETGIQIGPDGTVSWED